MRGIPLRSMKTRGCRLTDEVTRFIHDCFCPHNAVWIHRCHRVGVWRVNGTTIPISDPDVASHDLGEHLGADVRFNANELLPVPHRAVLSTFYVKPAHTTRVSAQRVHGPVFRVMGDA